VLVSARWRRGGRPAVSWERAGSAALRFSGCAVSFVFLCASRGALTAGAAVSEEAGCHPCCGWGEASGNRVSRTCIGAEQWNKPDKLWYCPQPLSQSPFWTLSSGEMSIVAFCRREPYTEWMGVASWESPACV